MFGVGVVGDGDVVVVCGGCCSSWGAMFFFFGLNAPGIQEGVSDYECVQIAQFKKGGLFCSRVSFLSYKINRGENNWSRQLRARPQ